MQDRRRSTRRRSYIGGQIAFNQRSSLMDCLVRNISGGGAKLVFTNTVTVPQEFDLSMQNARTYRAKVIWRRADEAGVAFLEPRPSSAPIQLDLARRLKACEAERDALKKRVERLCSAE